MKHRKGCIYIKVPTGKISWKKPSLKVKMKLSSYLQIRSFFCKMEAFLLEHMYEALIVLWMITIFCFSSQDGTASLATSQKAGGILRYFPLLSSLFMIIPIRKMAHMFLYSMLSFLFFVLFHTKKGWNIFLEGAVSVGAAFLYACTDEFHQLFVEGRGASFLDVIIDTAGASLSVILVITFLLYVKAVTKK